MKKIKLVSVFGFKHMFDCLPSVGIDFKQIAFNRAWRKNMSQVHKNTVLSQIKHEKPDVFFILKDLYANFILKYIRKQMPKTKIVMWYGDQRGYSVPPILMGRKGLLDALLLTNSDQKQKRIYKQFGIPYVNTFYHSFSTDEFKLWRPTITHDVFFGGSNFKHNKFPLSGLRTHLITSVHSKFKLVVHGGRWPFPSKKWVLRPQYAKELRKAKINLGINHYDIIRYYNRRLFESVASGKLHMTHYIRGMEKDFVNKKHLVWFKSVPEALSLINFYLKHGSERERIAANGRKHFINHHSWPIRVKDFRKLLEEIV